MSFILGERSKSTLEKNLCRLVYSVIFDNKNEPLSVLTILIKIKEDYDLNFSSSELFECIREDKNLDCIDEDKIQDEKQYRLVPKKYSQFLENEKKYNIEVLGEKFVTEFYPELDKAYVIQLFTRFIYGVFNKNKNCILELLNSNNTSLLEDSKGLDFSEQEKKIINDFLEWDNKEKNIFVYNTISYCVDYCMLSTNKEQNAICSVFSGKQFYLDSNVILRLIGFNNKERQAVLQSFTRKCKEVGIKLKYTNFTLDEINKTIEHYVKYVRDFNGDLRPVSQKQYNHFCSPERKDIMDLYTTWYATNKNIYNKYDDFALSLKKDVQKVIKDYEAETFKNQEVLNKADFFDYYKSLKDIKENVHTDDFGIEHKNYVNDNSVKVDVNNYLAIEKIRNEEKGNSVFNVNTYIISTDTKYCEWSKSLIPGQTPLCILPSTWYSIILKMYGRSENDFAAFNNFLSFRFKREPESDYKKKEEIISLVQRLDQPSIVKEKILDSIYMKLSQSSLDNYEPATIVAEEEIEKTEEELLSIWAKDGNPFIEKGEQGILDLQAEAKADRKYKVYSKIPKIFDIILIILWLSFAGLCVYVFISGQVKEVLKGFSKSEINLTPALVIAFINLIISISTSSLIKPIKRLFGGKTKDDFFKKEQLKLAKQISKLKEKKKQD